MLSCFLFGGTWKLKFMACCLLHSVVFFERFHVDSVGWLKYVDVFLRPQVITCQICLIVQ